MKRPEDILQRDIVQYLRTVLPETDYKVFAIPNGGKRGPAEAMMLKATGLMPGVPDLAILHRYGSIYFMEVKTPKGVLSPPQKAFKEWCLSGVPLAIVRSLHDVEEAVSVWRLKSRIAK